MNIVKGKDVLLEVWDTSLSTPAYSPFICLRDVSIDLDVELVNTTTPTAGRWNKYKARSLDYTVTLSGVTTILETGWNAFQSWEIDTIFSGYDIRLTFTDSAGANAVFTCSVMIETLSASGNQEDFSNFDKTLKGNGEYTLTRNGVTTGFNILRIPQLGAQALSTTSIGVTWRNVAGEASYRLEVSSDNVTWSVLATPAANTITYTHTGLTLSTTYYYRIKAVASSGGIDSGYSYASATTQSTMLIQLDAPVLTATVAGDTQINLSWTNVASESSYLLQYSPDGSVWTTITTPAANVTSFSHTGLAANTHYYYRLKAVGDNVAYGDSGYTYSDTTTTGGPVTEFEAEWNWYDSDPMSTVTGGGFSALNSATFAVGSPITVDTRLMPMDHYLVVRYPDTESDKTAWFNTSFNQGSIPDFVFDDIVEIGGFKYIVSRNPSTFDSTAQTTFS